MRYLVLLLILILVACDGIPLPTATPTPTASPTVPVTLTPTETPVLQVICGQNGVLWMGHTTVYTNPALTETRTLVLHAGEPFTLLGTNVYRDGYQIETQGGVIVWIPAYTQPVVCE